MCYYILIIKINYLYKIYNKINLLSNLTNIKFSLAVVYASNDARF